jgi:Flp pilus assembly protein TadG
MKSERGQALILIALGIAALLALTALAVDGGMAYAERRSSQNAVDNAALAAAYRILETGDQSQATAAAQTITNSNGFDEENSVFDIQFAPVPSDVCGGQGVDITVSLGTSTETSFGGTVGIDTVESTVAAVTRACFSRNESLFWGNAVVGLNPDTSFDATGTAGWEIQGGGIFANGDVDWGNNSCNKSTVPGIVSVGNTNCSPSGATVVENQTSLKVNYPADAQAIMPPNPCLSGGVGKADPHPNPKKKDTITYSNGVYCISNLSDKDGVNIVLDNATLYVTEKKIDLKFAGGGGFSGTATQSGPYAGYYMIVHLYPDQTCTKKNGKPEIVWTGNGLGNLEGTVLAPSACIDVRGNSDNKTMDSQVIGHTILSMGTADFSVNFNAEKNAQQPKPPILELLE